MALAWLRLLKPERSQPPEPASADWLLQDWKGAYQRAEAYLCALGIEAALRTRLALQAVQRAARRLEGKRGAGALSETLDETQRLVQETVSPAGASVEHSRESFLRWRFQRASAIPGTVAATASLTWNDGQIHSMPRLTRSSMAPNRLGRRGLRRAVVHHVEESTHETPARDPAQERRRRRKEARWLWPAHRRRLFLTFLVLIPSIVATGFMLEVLPHQGKDWLEVAIAVCFGGLFGWISIGFWTATIGFFVLTGRKDRFAITSGLEAETGPIDPKARTAILIPICEEPVDRVFAGLKATYRSLERTGQLDLFDFFVLSDSSDPGRWVDEEQAWFEWCRSVGGFGRIFYRRRRVRIERKSGNIADFCRRWGSQYRYMVMLDADSVMAGDTLVRLVRLMERNPNAGMVQTVPVAVNRRSLFARMQQFASRVYGPMFAAGLHFWQLGEGQYWGHNAIIRIEPFMKHCSLPRLPGKPPLGGEILSHDFVEAALMGRAGWELWLAFDLGGSYEETPSSLLEEMKRDRRWCQGNLQHLRLLRLKGLHGAHRALFLNGVLSYVSALLWFCFLTLSTAEAVWEAIREPEYFPAGRSLFPEWPVWRPDWALALLAVTGAILFLPKILSILLIALRSESIRPFGGFVRLSLSVLIEILLSALFAPIRMVFHARFVVLNLLGRTVAWRSQAREDSQTTWGEAIQHHGVDTLWAAAWGLSVHWLNPQFFWWLIPIVSALILSVPLSVLTSRTTLGDKARRFGLFLIPEESNPPIELRELAEEMQTMHARRESALAANGFVRAVVDPYLNAVHCMLLGPRRAVKASIHAARHAQLQRALTEGPAGLSPPEWRTILIDRDLMEEAHYAAWRLPRADAERWGIAA
jgi:membrane glycosyltransferase